MDRTGCRVMEGQVEADALNSSYCCEDLECCPAAPFNSLNFITSEHSPLTTSSSNSLEGVNSAFSSLMSHFQTSTLSMPADEVWNITRQLRASLAQIMNNMSSSERLLTGHFDRCTGVLERYLQSMQQHITTLGYNKVNNHMEISTAMKDFSELGSAPILTLTSPPMSVKDEKTEFVPTSASLLLSNTTLDTVWLEAERMYNELDSYTSTTLDELLRMDKTLREARKQATSLLKMIKEIEAKHEIIVVSRHEWSLAYVRSCQRIEESSIPNVNRNSSTGADDKEVNSNRRTTHSAKTANHQSGNNGRRTTPGTKHRRK